MKFDWIYTPCCVCSCREKKDAEISSLEVERNRELEEVQELEDGNNQIMENIAVMAAQYKRYGAGVTSCSVSYPCSVRLGPGSYWKKPVPPVLRIRDPVPFWPLDPGSGIGFFHIPYPGSQIHIFESLLTIFWLKSSIILWTWAQIFFSSAHQN